MSEPTRALSIRQPWAELILRGIKRIEYRSRSTTIVGERFWIYAAMKALTHPSPARPAVWSNDLTPDTPPAWMMQLADKLILTDLPRGVIVGSAVIEKVTRGPEFYHWHLAGVERVRTLRRPTGHPQPVWFNPF
jgi:hypothetical protein